MLPELRKSFNIYSTQSYLAYYINKHYYNDVHYCYCAKYFNDKQLSGNLHPQPASSSPVCIWRGLREALDTNDVHQQHVQVNISGLKRGVVEMLAKNVIDNQTAALLNAIIDKSPVQLFQPLLFVVPVEPNAGRIQRVPLHHKAMVLSDEYVVHELPGSQVEVLHWS